MTVLNLSEHCKISSIPSLPVPEKLGNSMERQISLGWDLFFDLSVTDNYSPGPCTNTAQHFDEVLPGISLLWAYCSQQKVKCPSLLKCPGLLESNCRHLYDRSSLCQHH